MTAVADRPAEASPEASPEEAPVPAGPGALAAWEAGAVIAGAVTAGDTLVVATTASGTQQQVDSLRARLEELLPGVTVVVLTGCSGLATYRESLPEISPPEISPPEISPPAAGRSRSRRRD